MNVEDSSLPARVVGKAEAIFATPAAVAARPRAKSRRPAFWPQTSFIE
jgi:hypothetical protein